MFDWDTLTAPSTPVGGASAQGFVHPTAQVGNPPEHRDWIADRTQPYYLPDIHPSATINAFATIDGGLYEPTMIGERTLLMAHTHVGHDARVGADCEVAPGSVLCGHVVLEDGVKVGANASIRPYIRVGKGARIGMGAVVVKDVPAGEVWAGNPARRIG